MSGSAAKVLRRDIRRAVGAEAVGVINQHGEALNLAMPTIQALVTRVAALEQQTQRHEHAILNLEALNADRMVRLGTRWARLRWLLGF